MKRTIRILLAALTLLVVALSLGSVAFRLIGARASGERLAGAEYSVLRNALAPVQDEASLADPFMRERLQSLYRGSARLLAAQVQDSGGLSVWRLPGDSPLFAPPSTPGARGGFIATGLGSALFSTNLAGGMKLNALYVTVSRSDLSEAAGRAALFLGGWLILAGIAAFLLARPEPALSGEIPADVRDEVRAMPDRSELPEAPAQDLEPESPDEFLEELSEEEPENVDAGDSADVDDVAEIDDVDEGMAEPELWDEEVEEVEASERPREETDELEAVPEPEAEFEPEPEPQFEPEPIQAGPLAAPARPPESAARSGSGIIAARVDENLSRAELQDLCVMLLHCDSAGQQDPALPAIGASVRDYFGAKDLVFERGTGAFALILPGMDLGKAIRMAEDLVDVLGTTISLYRDLDGPPPVYVGMSARAGRAGLESDIILHEAEAALARARSGSPSRILAFRADPAKYERAKASRGS